MKNRILPLIILLSLILSSCSLTFEKRHYRKGYHTDIVANHKRQARSTESDRINSQIVQVNQAKTTLLVKDPTVDVNLQTIEKVNLTKNNTQVKTTTKSKFIPNLKLADCDVITLKNGEEIEAVIVKISDNEIEYKKCNNKEGPSYIVKSSEVLLIKLKNGENYIPKESSNTNTSSNQSSKSGGDSPVVNILSFAFGFVAFILSILGWALPGGFFGLLILFVFGILLAITSIVLGAVGQKKKLKGLGIAGLILGILILIAAIAGLIFLIILFF
jgi:hypothetical protein